MLHGVAEPLLAGRWDTVMAGLAAPLVVHHPDRGVLGALLSLPPGQVLSRALDAGMHPAQVAVMAFSMAKVSGPCCHRRRPRLRPLARTLSTGPTMTAIVGPT
jgi:hypothetical protein